MADHPSAVLTALPPSSAPLLAGAARTPDLAAAGYVEEELLASGSAASYAGHAAAAYTTRVVVRRPRDPARASGTLLVEWLNVSSGQDAAPDWSYLAEEIVRRGHAWVGVSAQYVGVAGGEAAVPAAGLRCLKDADPERYAALDHPGDAYCYDLYSQVARAARDELGAACLLAIGESQSAFALTTYVNVVQPLTELFDGFLVHSRGGARLPLGEPGGPVDQQERLHGPPAPFRDDLATPVLTVQTETDLFGRIGYLPARQPDGPRLRVWEVAGTAHADRFQIGDFEELLGNPHPVNRGQQVFVVRAALRHLEAWARSGAAPPSAPPLELAGAGLAVDADGIARGGVRTPVVEAPVEVPTGFAGPDASLLGSLFGRTLPLAADRIRELWPTRAAYLAAYERATDAAIAAGFVLADDRAAVLAEARPDLVPG